MNEFFSATHWHTSVGFVSVFTENNTGLILHSKELHIEHCNALRKDRALSAIDDVLNSLEYSTVNYAAGIMQDLLEGYICMNVLSDRIQSLSYGYRECKVLVD